ncbi:hypothetical protein HDV01_006240 [Terramyces sp. JEL0728]|nr:hypothetical protein HDV01_006240 [Terramyces sp. JEL0728]
MESTHAYLNMMPKLESFNSDLDSNSSARISQSSFAEYAGSFVSTIGSWDETEQDYDVKATREVTEMVEQLDNLLYRDKDSAIDAGEILDECQQWTLLFPHIRICGVQMIPTKDSGFEIKSVQDARASSPYFFLPLHPASSNLPMQIQGHHLDSAFVHTADDMDAKENNKGNPNAWNLSSTIDWSDSVIREFIPRIEEFNVERWGVFKLQIEEDLHDRSSTPTPEHPHQEPKYENSFRYSVKLMKEGTGDIIAMRKTLESLAVYHSSNDLFAIQSDQIGKVDNNSIIVYTWKSSDFPNKLNLQQIAFDSQNSAFSFDFKLGFLDFMNQLKGLNMGWLLDPKRPYSAESGNMVLENIARSVTHTPENPSLQILKLDQCSEDEVSDDDLLSAITIRPVPLQKRGSSSRVRSEIPGFQSANPGLAVLESRPTSARPIQRPTSARSNLSRPTSARPQEPSPMRTQMNISKGGNTWKRGSTGLRLMPLLSSTQNGINEMIHVTSLPLNQQKATANWIPQANQPQHLSKKLPPIKGIMSNLDAFDTPKPQKHVNFDPTLEPTEVQKRVPSPRPFSARRQISSPFRTRTVPLSRPQTAISDRNASGIAKLSYKRGSYIQSDDKPFSPVMGVRMTSNSLKSSTGRRGR